MLFLRDRSSRLSDYLPTAARPPTDYQQLPKVWEKILLGARTILTGVGPCNTHHSDTPERGSIQMVENENKKSFNDCFDLETLRE